MQGVTGTEGMRETDPQTSSEIKKGTERIIETAAGKWLFQSEKRRGQDFPGRAGSFTPL
jgi:hypothetical protein